jgi:hypothetical protein
MVNVDKIAREILSALSIQTLERQYDNIKEELKAKDVVKLPIKDLRILLAYEYLKDGAEKSFVEEVLNSKDTAYANKIDILKQLKVFDY